MALKKRLLPHYFAVLLGFISVNSLVAQVAKAPFLPSLEEINKPFGAHDEDSFLKPSKVHRPETWFHYIGGNVSEDGITRDLEAIAKAGYSGIHLFHGQFGGPWPGVEPQITSLSPHWDEAVRHTAKECERLGLRFVMNNTAGWATSGGPWIEPANAMRHLTMSRTDLTQGGAINQVLPLAESSKGVDRDYKDIAVLAFPTPLDDTGEPLVPKKIESNTDFRWDSYLAGKASTPIQFSPTTPEKPHWVEVTFEDPVMLRSVEFPSINSFNHGQCYEPGVSVSIQAVLPDGQVKDILKTDMPQSNWQDDRPITLACSEVEGVNKYRISIVNKYDMKLSSLRLFSAARKNSWESEAGWTLRSIERVGQSPDQSDAAFVSPEQVLDISSSMDDQGSLKWTAPKGNWTILRIGHVNTGARNSPAPPEGTGWEANKLSKLGANAHFAGYIGRLVGQNGPLADGLLNGMLIDSWECHTQTWTSDMEAEFNRVASYKLRKWLPAMFGYVMEDHKTTAGFLYDWRRTISDLVTNNFYGRMAELAHDNDLYITYETAPGDVFPADILEYFKFADIPMCEFWLPMSDGYVGSLNFKPIKPTASAARMYGKPRVAAESFTDMSLSWDEHLEDLKEAANINSIEGVSHFVFHTYTHNPQTPFLPPGSSFGANIGTPFLRGQTWWGYVPDFQDYLARCSYLLERGKPVSDVLWYLGDEINHKPDQKAPFPHGFKYDYCNPDVLLNRLSVKDGLLVTPEGIQYRVLWLPDVPRMLPETLEKIQSLIQQGATVVGNPPQGLATLGGGKASKKRFETAVKNIWKGADAKGINRVGKGYVLSGMPLDEALAALEISPDVTGDDALWSHRQIEGADWYFVSAPRGQGVSGTLDFRNSGHVELWDPVTGQTMPAQSERSGDRTQVKIDLARAGSVFVVFRNDQAAEKSEDFKEKELVSTVPFSGNWTLSFPAGWGAPERLELTELRAWKDLDISEEGKAFSGTATYTHTVEIDKIDPEQEYILELGEVDMVAAVSVNDQKPFKMWAAPYSVNITDMVKAGKNTISIAVTNTWFNRLVYDAGLPEDQRKTWTVAGPNKEAPLRNTGLMGPVVLQVYKTK
ncbi:MAG: glycosyl hydrolase [Sphingobacterium sp.]